MINKLLLSSSIITVPLSYLLFKKYKNYRQKSKLYKNDTIIFKNLDETQFTFLIKNIVQNINTESNKNVYILCQNDHMIKIPFNKLSIEYKDSIFILNPIIIDNNVIGYNISTYNDNIDEFVKSMCSDVISPL